MHALIAQTGYMAINPEPPSAVHTLALLDESSESTLAICKCGARFLEVGPGHPAEARYSHAMHRYKAMLAIRRVDDGGREPLQPVAPGAPKRARRKHKAGADKRSAQTAELIALIENDGYNVTTAAKAMGIAPATGFKRLHDADRDDLIKKRPRRPRDSDAA